MAPAGKEGGCCTAAESLDQLYPYGSPATGQVSSQLAAASRKVSRALLLSSSYELGCLPSRGAQPGSSDGAHTEQC